MARPSEPQGPPFIEVFQADEALAPPSSLERCAQSRAGSAASGQRSSCGEAGGEACGEPGATRSTPRRTTAAVPPRPTAARQEPLPEASPPRAALFRLSCPHPPRRPSLNRQLPPRSHCRRASAPVSPSAPAPASPSATRSEPLPLAELPTSPPVLPASVPATPVQVSSATASTVLPRQRFRRARRHLSSPARVLPPAEPAIPPAPCPSRLRSLPTRSSRRRLPVAPPLMTAQPPVNTSTRAEPAPSAGAAPAAPAQASAALPPVRDPVSSPASEASGASAPRHAASTPRVTTMTPVETAIPAGTTPASCRLASLGSESSGGCRNRRYRRRHPAGWPPRNRAYRGQPAREAPSRRLWRVQPAHKLRRSPPARTS